MVIPAPRHLVEHSESFLLCGETVIAADASTQPVALRLQADLRAGTGLLLQVVGRAASHRSVIDLSLDSSVDDGGYQLSVETGLIRLVGGGLEGLFHATQTLRQLLPADTLRSSPVSSRDDWAVPGITIDDAPSYLWRGLMIDVARRFMPVREVLRIVDLMALHHLNVLHLHLTDDQGWRIPVDGYPLLSQISSWRSESQIGAAEDAPGDGRPHGGSYSRDDLAEIIAYAAARYITVVPEVETPGHARSVLAAYPQFGVTGTAQPVWTRWGISEDIFNVEEETFSFLFHVLDEVIGIFPGPFIAIGGDECPKQQWRADPRTQQRMHELGLKDEEALQAWFIARLEQHLAHRGRRTLGWDEVLEGGTVSSNTIVLSWRGLYGAATAARRGHDVVSCPDDQAYLDYRQAETGEPIPVSIPLTLQDVYAFNPVPEGLTEAEQRHILGGQANLFTEHVDTPARSDYMLFPRLGAFAEALWLGPDRDLDDFTRRLPGWLLQLDALGVQYRPLDGPAPWQQVPGVSGRPASRAERDHYMEEITANIRSAETQC